MESPIYTPEEASITLQSVFYNASNELPPTDPHVQRAWLEVGRTFSNAIQEARQDSDNSCSCPSSRKCEPSTGTPSQRRVEDLPDYILNNVAKNQISVWLNNPESLLLFVSVGHASSACVVKNNPPRNRLMRSDEILTFPLWGTEDAAMKIVACNIKYYFTQDGVIIITM